MLTQCSIHQFELLTTITTSKIVWGAVKDEGVGVKSGKQEGEGGGWSYLSPPRSFPPDPPLRVVWTIATWLHGNDLAMFFPLPLRPVIEHFAKRYSVNKNSQPPQHFEVIYDAPVLELCRSFVAGLIAVPLKYLWPEGEEGKNDVSTRALMYCCIILYYNIKMQ